MKIMQTLIFQYTKPYQTFYSIDVVILTRSKLLDTLTILRSNNLFGLHPVFPGYLIRQFTGACPQLH